MLSVKEKIKKFFIRLVRLMPLRNYILFESYPDYSDNTKYVFEEMVRRGLNKKYKFVWMLNDEERKDFPKIKNVRYVYKFDNDEKKYYWFAKAIISCNCFLMRKRKEQYYIYLAHGCAMKNTVDKYCLPDHCKDADVVTVSEFTRKYDAINLDCSEEQFRILGFPRNDILFEESIDLKKVFPHRKFNKVIYWLPTYRQHNTIATRIHSNIAMPILYSEEIAVKINDYAKSQGVLIVVKPHPVQDISRLKALDMENLLFIDNDFLEKKSIENYQLLGSCDAMISDYSSVYYDYLLCNKPIGLCWDDFEEYNKREGFTVDPNFIMAGGEKIYNADDFCAFVSRVANGEDILKEQREKIRDIVQKYSDGNSTKRVVDYIMTKLK